MKKLLGLVVFLALAAFPSFADEAQADAAANRQIFIEGTAPTVEEQDFFLKNFALEAIAAGYGLAEHKADAGYTFKFEVTPNTVLYDDGGWDWAPPDEKQFVIRIALVRNTDEAELISFSFLFENLDEMYEYNQDLFLKAAIYIPAPEPVLVEVLLNDDWRNKWLYFRASFDYPVTAYVLRGDGLSVGIGAYDGDDFLKPDRVMPLDNKITALPGITLGAEAQFLNWMSVELNGRLSMDDLQSSEYFYNLTVSLELKFPLKFVRYLMIEPYAAGAVLFPFTDVFTESMYFGFGGGVQVGVKGGKNGAFFVDANYIYYGDVARYNPYGPLYPNPPEIHYQRFIVGLGVGYKIGFFDRQK